MADWWVSSFGLMKYQGIFHYEILATLGTQALDYFPRSCTAQLCVLCLYKSKSYGAADVKETNMQKPASAIGCTSQYEKQRKKDLTVLYFKTSKLLNCYHETQLCMNIFSLMSGWRSWGAKGKLQQRQPMSHLLFTHTQRTLIKTIFSTARKTRKDCQSESDKKDYLSWFVQQLWFRRRLSTN